MANTPLEDVLLDAKGMRELGFKVPTEAQIREREQKINNLRDGGMKIHEITDYLTLLLGD